MGLGRARLDGAAKPDAIFACPDVDHSAGSDELRTFLCLQLVRGPASANVDAGWREFGVVSVSGEVAEFSEGLADEVVYIAGWVGYPRVDRVPQCGGADLGQERRAPFGKSALL